MLCAIVLLSLTTLALGLSSSVLEVSVSAIASTVASVDDIVISAMISNPTDKDIRVIARNNILDTSPTRSFNVSNANDEIVLFTGPGGIYMTIPAGGYVVVNLTNIGALYDFESYGAGTFTFVPIALFQGGPASPIEVVDIPALKIKITHDVKRRDPYHRLTTAECSDPYKQEVLKYSLSDFREFLIQAYNDFGDSTEELKTYFSAEGLIHGKYSIYDFLYLMILVSDGEIMQWVIEIFLFGEISFLFFRISCDLDPAGICGGSGGVITYTLIDDDNFVGNVG
ncbi:hypothetical protein C0993_008422 [Termitomyces sp. T159_Od127]|nr:hypothetical protein C0993_008422 [Termitomyces sp. T159_Od127]